MGGWLAGEPVPISRMSKPRATRGSAGGPWVAVPGGEYTSQGWHGFPSYYVFCDLFDGRAIIWKLCGLLQS